MLREFNDHPTWRRAVDEAGHAIDDGVDDGMVGGPREAYTLINDPDPQWGAPVGIWFPLDGEGVLADTPAEYDAWLTYVGLRDAPAPDDLAGRVDAASDWARDEEALNP